MRRKSLFGVDGYIHTAPPMKRSYKAPAAHIIGGWDADVCLNCTKKKCRGGRDCFAKAKEKAKAESEVAGDVR